MPTPPSDRDRILRTLLKFGDDGPQALRQLALYGDATIRPQAVLCLAKIDRGRYVADLVTAMHAADAGEQETDVARRFLARPGETLPSRRAAAEALRHAFDAALDRARRTENDGQVTTLWSIGSDRKQLESRPASAMIAAYRDLFDAASRLRRLGNLDAETTGAVLQADLGYRVLVDPDWGDPQQVDQMNRTYGSLLSGMPLSTALHRAVRGQDAAAAVGLIRCIDTEDVSVLDRNVWLGGGGEPAPLVRAAMSPQPRVRYEAALTAFRIAQGSPYSGSSRVLRTLGEMRSLSDRPTAIVVETRSDVAMRLESILSRSGYRVIRSTSVAGVQRDVASAADLRLILSKTELPDLPAVEMIDLIRRMPRSSGVPILLYGAAVPSLAESRWAAPTIQIDPPASAAALDGVLDAVRRQRRLPQLSEVDRIDYRTAAETLLSGPQS